MNGIVSSNSFISLNIHSFPPFLPYGIFKELWLLTLSSQPFALIAATQCEHREDRGATNMHKKCMTKRKLCHFIASCLRPAILQHLAYSKSRIIKSFSDTSVNSHVMASKLLSARGVTPMLAT